MIPYHGTPLGGTLVDATAITGRHSMVSFARPDQVEIVAELSQSFCLDNGAFTAWRNGSEYDFDEYYRWATHWIKHPGCDFAIIPDVIDGTEKQNDDLVAMYSAIRSPFVPVWHLHESIERLERLCLCWQRVALGSSGEYADPGNKAWWRRMAEALDAITDKDGVPFTKLHGLRMLDPGIFSYIPFSSADSTNVARSMGIDKRWGGPYVPTSQRVRALVIMDRIESHAAATHWVRGRIVDNQQNFELVG